MNNEELYNYINLFRDKALNNKLIIFVGSGVSRNVDGMPSWSNLVEAMAKEIGYSKCNNKKCGNKDNCAHITGCPLVKDLSTDEFLKIPQYLFNDDRDKYNKILKENIQHPKVNAPLSDVIFDVNPVHIITTNYDRLLEDSTNELREQYQVIINDKDLLNSDKSKYIIKMHGDIEDADSIVLKEDDYLNYSQEHVLIELFVKSLLVDHTILFLGYSLSDYNIKLILSWINYMRTANKKAINKKDKIGYIVLDEKKIDRRTVSYFKSNNIGIVNINTIGLYPDIPNSLNNEMGKRLYSFLKEISEPSIENSILQLDKYKFVDYREVMNIQKIFPGRYELADGQLRLFSELDYNKVVNLLNSDSSISSKLKSIFITSGIEELTCYNSKHILNFEIGLPDESKLFQNKLFKLYFHNQFIDLENELSAMKGDTLEYVQYYSFLFGYDEKLDNALQKIDYNELEQDEIVAYLHNKAALEGIRTYIFTANNIINYINNIQPKTIRKLFSAYLEIYDGNPKEFSQMLKALEQLKKDVSTKNHVRVGQPSYYKLFAIKNYTISHYNFYFLNNIFFAGFSDFRNFLRPYIEGILCANSEVTKMPSTLFDEEIPNSKYPIDALDIDIITKFTKTKELQELLLKYKIIGIDTTNNVIQFAVNCFVNMSDYIIKKHAYGFGRSFIEIISNLSILLSLVEMDFEHKRVLTTALQKLFLDKDFCNFLFSSDSSSWQCYVKGFSKLCLKLNIRSNFSIIQNIFDTGGFKYCLSKNFSLVREIVLSFVNKYDFMNIESEVITLIDDCSTVKDKILFLRIFFRYISDSDFKSKMSLFLSDNFKNLDGADIFEFMDGNWITFSEDNIEQIYEDIFSLIPQKSADMVKCYPDLMEEHLFKIYILYLEDVIKDVSRLEGLANSYPHLQFLIYPDQFDYSQVDFTNYMWKNFIRYEKTRSHLIANKDVIIKYLKEKFRNSTISEIEKEILYRFFLSDNENLLN